MIQNTTPANQPVQPNPMARPNQTEDFIRLQDLLYLCLTQWRWFILSLVVTCGIAIFYPYHSKCISANCIPDDQG